MKELKGFDGQIVLYCKGHYNLKDVDFIKGLQHIWAARCGYDVEHVSDRDKEYIANHLYDILAEVAPKKLQYMMVKVHKALVDNWMYKELTGIERVIMAYHNELMQLQVKESKPNGKGYITLLKLPRTRKQAMKRIVRGNGRSGDYRLIEDI